ncbi:NUDIX hydrolase [Oceaniovalibus guishaninsula]|nr:NUDIX hydrolase [Oceaniovalibus guishaninsula]
MTDLAADRIRDAATIVVIRDPAGPLPRVLMGQRGLSAVFMPSKYVFPGGAVDPGDHDIALARPLPNVCAERLVLPGEASPHALAAAAIRELWEETGQILGQPGDWADPPPDWTGFAARGFLPDAARLTYVFRAITPPGRPRRFDARFFVTDAANLQTDPDDFDAASEELGHLHWVPIAEARKLDLPFITTVALAEIATRLPDLSPPDRIPFFRNDDEDIAIANAALR